MDKDTADRLVPFGLMKLPVVDVRPLLRLLTGQVERLSNVMRYMFDEIEHSSDYCKRTNRDELVDANIDLIEIKKILDAWMCKE